QVDSGIKHIILFARGRTNNHLEYLPQHSHQDHKPDNLNITDPSRGQSRENITKEEQAQSHHSATEKMHWHIQPHIPPIKIEFQEEKMRQCQDRGGDEKDDGIHFYHATSISKTPSRRDGVLKG